MDKVARLGTKDRMELFMETAGRKRLPSALIEKDFWVCWSLGRLFSLPQQPASMIFKGGTSLSKVFNAISRFSEDVDLSLNREDLGFVDERSPQDAPSRKKAQRLIEELSEPGPSGFDSGHRPQVGRASLTVQLPVQTTSSC